MPPRVQPERPAPTLTLDTLASYVPSIRAGVRALRRETSLARSAFRPTDVDFLARDAHNLDQLARLLDVRGVRP
jgi:hypothetical protein